MHLEYWDDAKWDDSYRVKHLANFVISQAQQDRFFLSIEKLQRILTDVHAHTLVRLPNKVFQESPSCMGDYPLYESIHDLLQERLNNRSWLTRWRTQCLSMLSERPETVSDEFKHGQVYLTPSKDNTALLNLLTTIYKFYRDNEERYTFPMSTGINSAYAIARKLGMFYISDDILERTIRDIEAVVSDDKG